MATKDAFETFAPVTLIFLLLSCVSWHATLITYRLYFHPLSRFPGPKAAAAGIWYVAYYGLFGIGGQYTAKIRQLHRQYGPLVRVNPNEISINDPDFHEQLYAGQPAVRDKIKKIANILGTTAGSFGTIDSHTHRKRRAAKSRFFSLENITKAEPLIRKHVQILCDWFQVCGNSVAWELRVQFTALKLDMFYDFGFGEPLQLLQRPREAEGWDQTMEAIATCASWLKLVPWVLPIAVNLRPWLVSMISPPIARVLRIRHQTHDEAKRSALMKNDVPKETVQTLFFPSLLDSNLPAHEKTVWRMAQEGSEMFAASGTTARIMYGLMFYILDRREVLERLQNELDERIPDPARIPPLKVLESFPYMEAVIKEALRIHAPVCTRLPLVAKEVMKFKEWCIPPGTAISVNGRDLHHNPAIYPDPFTFKPERWLVAEVDIVRAFQQRHSNVSRERHNDFSFAMAELRTTIAYLIRLFDFELEDTTWEKNVKIVRDCFLSEPQPPGTRGPKVKVLRMRN